MEGSCESLDEGNVDPSAKLNIYIADTANNEIHIFFNQFRLTADM